MDRCLVLFWVFVVVSSCMPAPESASAVSDSAVTATVDSLMRDYIDAIVVGDWRRATSHYANEPDFRVFSTGVPLGFDSLVATVRRNAERRRSLELEPVDVEVTVLSESTAIAAFTHRQRRVDTAGVVTPLRGSASWVWVRRGDGWKILHGAAVHLPDTVH